MRKKSIKKRVMFWYAFSMTVIIALVFFILILAGQRAALDDARTSLTISTDMAVNNVTVTDGRLVIDDDFVYYMDHTWIVLIRDDGVTISGLTPEDFPADVPFLADRIRKVGRGTSAYYVYDRLLESQSIGKVWIRGMTSASLTVRDPAISRMIGLFLIVLPVLIGLSLAGGWEITRRSFLPLKQITDTVTQIQEGKDLSRRIGSDSEKSRDEIQAVAAAFDCMLDRIEDSFGRERQFTDDASHELRTPTAVIQAQCEYALENLSDPKEIKEALMVIHGQSKRMADLIDQLLMLARADRNAVHLERRMTDIGLLAEEAAAIYRKAASERQITICVMAQEGIYAPADASLISRAIENLLSNALKYGKAGGHVTISVQKGEAGVELHVADDGVGIAEKEIEKIWNRFYRVNPSGREEGMGLGLPLVKWIVEAHGGSITVESVPEKYTDFAMFLPL